MASFEPALGLEQSAIDGMAATASNLLQATAAQFEAQVGGDTLSEETLVQAGQRSIVLTGVVDMLASAMASRTTVGGQETSLLTQSFGTPTSCPRLLLEFELSLDEV